MNGQTYLFLFSALLEEMPMVHQRTIEITTRSQQDGWRSSLERKADLQILSTYLQSFSFLLYYLGVNGKAG